jgi:hypothetical protein
VKPRAERERLAEGGFCGRCGHHAHLHKEYRGRCTGGYSTHGGLHTKPCDCPSFQLAYRNEISAARGEANRQRPGAYTFNAFPPDDYEGLLLVVHAVRVGDHAHVKVESGRQVAKPKGGDGLSLGGRPTVHYGYAGKLVLRWSEWIKLRDDLELLEWTRIAEVECPTPEQARRYLDSEAR